ncbi:hypothetical protein [Singulisphaera acidiphila]|uniref:hypothetical protein n=1 Tax=Singulisphaera acidiphila TaxID=466153 RepID=UPI000368252C|nr:hypothetical protein [Singulisphaera acidiphila]
MGDSLFPPIDVSCESPFSLIFIPLLDEKDHVVMTRSCRLRHLAVFAVLVAPLAGCSGGGTTQDTVPTQPPVTKENAADVSKQINAGAAGFKPPGVRSPSK